MVFLARFCFWFVPAFAALAQTYTVSTFAGGTLPVNIAGTGASLYGPQSAMAVDSSGNLFFADGNSVLRLDAASGMLTLVAGNGTAGYSGDNGPATSAQVRDVYGLAVDFAGNLYISGLSDHVVRRVSGGIITTVAMDTQLSFPYGVAVDTSGNLYVADSGNHRILKISAGVATTVAGDGTAGFGGDGGAAADAQLNAPFAVAVAASGDLYISDRADSRIRKVSGGVITTYAGNGTAGFSGDNGAAAAAQLNFPCGIAFDGAGNLVIADYYNNRVRKVSAGIITTIAGTGVPGFGGDNGTATAALLNHPFALAAGSGTTVYVADYGNNRIRRISSGTITTVAGNGTAGLSGDGGSPLTAQLRSPYSIALSSSGDLYTADYQNHLVRGVSAGVINTVATQFTQPSAVALDASGTIYVADFGDNTIRKLSGGIVSTVAGNGTAGFAGDAGPAVDAELNQPAGLALDSSGNIYIADSANNRIRKVSGTTISTFAGTGVAGFSGDNGTAASAQLNNPTAVAVDSAGAVYITDTGNNRVRKVAGGVISTVANNLHTPGAIALSGSTLFIADTLSNTILRASGAAVTAIADASFGLAGPQGIAVDASGNIYVADTLNNRIRLLTPVPLGITGPPVLPTGIVGTAYAGTTFTAAGGIGPYTWSATGLPKGLTFSAAGVLSGNPSAQGTATAQFTVKDSSLTAASVSIPIQIDFPVPVIATLSPAAATAAGATFTLTVNGTGFVTGAVIQWNGNPLTTRLVSATQVTASVAANLIASTGAAIITVSSGGSVSNAVDFPINPPIPKLTAISPKSATATGPAFTLTATGTVFIQSSQLQWDGTPLTTTFVSTTQLTAEVPAQLIDTAGTANVTVASGPSSSTAQTFTVNPPPTIASLNPESATAYGSAFTLTVKGSGFAQGASVLWNSSALTTKLVSTTQLTASVPANLIGGAGNVNVAVNLGGVQSGTFQFPINPAPPTIKTLAPASAIATASAFTLTVSGTGFTQNATVTWNAAAVPTAFVSATELTAYISASLIADAGSASVVVSAGSASSASAAFTITAPPTVTTLNPASAIAQSGAFTLTVNGSGFISGAQVQWNGTPLVTTFVSATKLTATVGAALVSNIGSVTIQVNESGASSNGAIFGITGPPAITSLSPAGATAGAAAFTLTVNGTGFLSGAAVLWNGTALTTKFVSDTQLTASIAAGLISTAGTANVAVRVSGVASANAPFPINAPPVITALNPGSVQGNGAAFTLTVTGTGFQSGATVQWNGTTLTTNYASATQLTASVPANLAAGSGTASIVASNQGGSVSAAMKLTITAVPPAVTTGGVVPLYSSTSVIQAGSWISIYGNALGSGTYIWKGEYPTSLGGTSVKIDGKAAYLWSVSPTQINLQAPNNTATGPVNVVVTTPSGTTTSTVTLAPYGPSFSLLPASNYVAGIILNSNGYDVAGPTGMFAFDTRPVRAGETMALYGVGFGPTNPAVPAGKSYSGAAPTTNIVTVTIGGIPAKVLFSGLVQSGVYQLNIVVPATPSGDQPLIASVGGVQTQSGVLVRVQ